MIGHMVSQLQRQVLMSVRRKAVSAVTLREAHGRSIYAAITALEARGLVETAWDNTVYPPAKVITITDPGRAALRGSQ